MESVGADVIVEAKRERLSGDFFPLPTSGDNAFPILSRFDGDSAFYNMITSSRFIYLDAQEDRVAIQRLRAKQHIGGSSLPILVATQTWTGGDVIPGLPSIPVDDTGVFTDLEGMVRVPSQSMELDESHQKRIDDSLGQWVAKSKQGCIMSLLEGHPLLEEDGSIVDFPQRSGYIELQNAMILFVTLPLRPGNSARSYPNEWMEDGSILTWFLREYDWRSGGTDVAKKLLGTADSDNSQSTAILFARRGKGHFLCCGRCRIVESPTATSSSSVSSDATSTTRDGKLVKLFLLLQDWAKLHEMEDFRTLVDP
jgi:hypothetical protein